MLTSEITFISLFKFRHVRFGGVFCASWQEPSRSSSPAPGKARLFRKMSQSFQNILTSVFFEKDTELKNMLTGWGMHSLLTPGTFTAAHNKSNGYAPADFPPAKQPWQRIKIF